MQLREALQLFLMEDRAPSTNDSYSGVLRKALAFFGPERDIDLITREDVQRYVQHLREQNTRYEGHSQRPPESGGLSPKTIEKRVKTLVTFFRWLQDNGHRTDNPAGNLRLRRYQRPPGSSKAATPDELQAILHVAEAKATTGKPKHLAVFLFLADTGSRAGEAASLLIGNLDLKQMGAWVLGKGDKLRPVYYGHQTTTALRAWLEVHPHPVADDIVFGMTADSLSQVIARLAQQAGIERPIGAHAIRHRVGQVWAAARMSEQATQLKLGHDDPAVTVEMYYNTTWDQIQRASLELALAAIFGLPSEPTRLQAPMTPPASRETERLSGA
jgi:site-specific recombinase XerD